MQQRTTGQTAENHRCHQFVHVHLLWTPLTAGEETEKEEEVAGVRFRLLENMEINLNTQTEEMSHLLGTSMQEETDLQPDGGT